MRSVALSIILSCLISGTPALAQQPSDQTPRPTEPPAPSESRPGIFAEPRGFGKALDAADRKLAGRKRSPKDGFYLELGNSITGAGLFSAGPGYRRHMMDRQVVFTTSGAVSMRLYTMAQVKIEAPTVTDRISVGAQMLFRDALQVNYFGRGSDSNLLDRSGYRLQTNDTTAYFNIGAPALSFRARTGWLQLSKIGAMAGRLPEYPNTIDAFNDLEAPGLTTEPSFLHGDLALSSDTRNFAGYPTRGGFYQATWTLYSDQKSGQHSFQRYDLEASHYLPMGTDNWVLGLRAAAVFSNVAAGSSVPIYLMPNLGGRNLRSFPDFRFHDNNMQSYGVESRLRLFTHLDAVAFVDLGSVAPTVHALSLSDLKRSYGAGIRLHNQQTSFGRVDVARGEEGWKILFRMNDPFRRTAQSGGWRPAAPFIP